MLQRKINGLRSLIYTIQLPSKYIPNTREHLKSFDKELIKNAFSASIEDNTVEKLGFKLESSYKIESDLKKIYKNVKR